jgi:fluoride exporter
VLVAVGCGGAVGAAARHALTALPDPVLGWLPLGTLVANVLGTVALGMLVTAPAGLLPWERLTRPALGAGLCGGLTTFSTLALELTENAGGLGGAAGYALLSLLLAPLSALAGVLLMRAVAPRPDAEGGDTP